MRLGVMLLHPSAVIPVRAHNDDAGYDLHAIEAATIEPGGRLLVRTGIAIELPPGHAGLVVLRSSLAANHGITMLNAPGLIDSGYRGEVRFPLLNTDPEVSFTIAVGERIAQLVVIAVASPVLVEVESLTPSARGGGGFGSTGRSARNS